MRGKHFAHRFWIDLHGVLAGPAPEASCRATLSIPRTRCRGDKYWQSLKHAWQAMFHSSSLRGYMGLMNASAEQLADVLAAKAETGEEVEIWRLFGCLTLEVVGSTAFG